MEHLGLDRDEWVEQDGGEEYVTEPGLYRLALRPDGKASATFRRWVVHEVLPTIRKHGCYPAPEPGVAGRGRAIVRVDGRQLEAALPAGISEAIARVNAARGKP